MTQRRQSTSRDPKQTQQQRLASPDSFQKPARAKRTTKPKKTTKDSMEKKRVVASKVPLMQQSQQGVTLQLVDEGRDIDKRLEALQNFLVNINKG
jgi:hypothetical protein